MVSLGTLNDVNHRKCSANDWKKMCSQQLSEARVVIQICSHLVDSPSGIQSGGDLAVHGAGR